MSARYAMEIHSVGTAHGGEIGVAKQPADAPFEFDQGWRLVHTMFNDF